jgi:hypothetical protein
MGVMRKTVSSAVVAAMMATAATPAFAGGYGGGYGGGTYISSGFGYGSGYGRGYRRRHHRDRVDAGDVIAGIAVIGVIAAIASSASKKKQQRQAGGGYPPRDIGRDDGRSTGRINSETEAVDACAMAAEERGGNTASVRDISQVDKTNDGWDIEGVIEERDNWRDRSGERRRFTCSVRYGNVDHVYIDTDSAALR